VSHATPHFSIFQEHGTRKREYENEKQGMRYNDMIKLESQASQHLFNHHLILRTCQMLSSINMNSNSSEVLNYGFLIILEMVVGLNTTPQN